MSKNETKNKGSKKDRSIISLFTLLIFLGISITGILIYFQPYSISTATLHTTFAIFFVILAVLHIKNNWRTLLNNLKPSDKMNKKKWFAAIIVVILIILIGGLTGAPPFKSIVDLGDSIRNSNVTEKVKYTIINTKDEISGNDILVEMKAGEHYYHDQQFFLWMSFPVTPQIAIWIEDADGNFIETLYITEKGAKGSFIGFGSEEVRRKEALPIWSHKRGQVEKDGLFMPTRDNPLPDAVTGASPESGMILNTKVAPDLEEFVIFIEVNKGFDYNNFYAYDLESGDPGYNTGYSGQPAVVYSAKINRKDGVRYYFPELIGHSSPTGDNGELSTDTSNLDTSLLLIDRIIVDVK
jgi:uncharacterized protein DUF4405